jgi:hypothetical protein
MDEENETTNPIWDLHIVRAQNGYILTDQDGRDSVIEEDEQDELKAHEHLLWQIMEYFAFEGSRHDKERIRVIREKGDKYNG